MEQTNICFKDIWNRVTEEFFVDLERPMSELVELGKKELQKDLEAMEGGGEISSGGEVSSSGSTLEKEIKVEGEIKVEKRDGEKEMVQKRIERNEFYNEYNENDDITQEAKDSSNDKIEQRELRLPMKKKVKRYAKYFSEFPKVLKTYCCSQFVVSGARQSLLSQESWYKFFSFQYAVSENGGEENVLEYDI